MKLFMLVVGYALGVATIMALDKLERDDREYYNRTGKVRPWGVIK